MKNIKLLEIFTGGGGLAIGLHNAGFRSIGFYEWDHDSIETLSNNIKRGFPLGKIECVHEADVRTIDFSFFSNEARVLAGGPPCQPFSLGGKAKGNDDARDMFPEAARALSEIKPNAFVFENVAGLLRESFKPYFDYIIRSLKYPDIKREDKAWEEHNLELLEAEQRGDTPFYNINYCLFNVADYGVPQNRKRVIIVGFKSSLGIWWNPPHATHSKNALLYDQWISGEYWQRHNLIKPECPLSALQLKRISLRHNSDPSMPWRTVRDAIFDLPDPKAPNLIPNHEFRKGARFYDGHSGSSLDEPSKTIKAGAHGVPGGENMVVLDDGSCRYFTVRESARIQTFPDDYIFTSSWGECMRQIGNAVPCKFAEVIGSSIIKQLEELVDDRRTKKNKS